MTNGGLQLPTLPAALPGVGAAVKSAFPVDVWAVKRMGVDAWLDGFPWPVSDLQMRALYRDVDEMYVNLINEVDPDLSDAFTVIFNSTAEYFVSVLNALLVKSRLREAGIPLDCTPGTRHFSERTAGPEDLSGLTLKGFLPPLPSSWDRFRGVARSTLDQIKYRGLDARTLLGISRERDCLCFYHPTPQNQWYAKSIGKGITIVHPRQFMPRRPIAAGESLPGESQAVDRLVDGLERVAGLHGILLEDANLEQFRNVIRRCIGPVGGYISQIRGLLRLRKPTEILVDGLGNSFKRGLCVAGRREGFRMVGFTHGNTAGMSKIPGFAYVDMAMVDTYVVPTRASARLFTGMQEKYRLQHDRKTEMVSMDDEGGRKLWMENRDKPVAPAIRSVLIVENPILDNINRDLYLYWPHHLELLLRIGKNLRKTGVRTILKRHPDRLKESEGLYEPYFDEVLVERFEKVYENSDALFFPYICTSTFGFSLLTTKPIIFFETMLDSVADELHELLKKRCRVIPSRFDSKGKLLFDEKSLLEAISRPPEAPDTGFIERYMLT